jgi:transposase
MTRKSYATDLTDPEWALLQPILPADKPRGRKRTVSRAKSSISDLHPATYQCKDD